jgi:hypothetical protein
MTGKDNPARCPDAEDRARDHRARTSRESDYVEQTDFAVTHIAIRRPLSLSLERVAVTLATRSGALE